MVRLTLLQISKRFKQVDIKIIGYKTDCVIILKKDLEKATKIMQDNNIKEGLAQNLVVSKFKTIWRLYKCDRTKDSALS